MSVANADGRASVCRIPLLGFEIEKRTDFLALAAFCLAAIGGGYQVVGYLKGSDVVLFAPEAVMIVFDRYQPNLRVVRMIQQWHMSIKDSLVITQPWHKETGRVRTGRSDL